MSAQFSNIPRELCLLEQWVCWRLEKVNGRETKVPYQPSGRKAASTRSETWSTFDQVLKACTSSNRFSGIGFVFSRGGGLIGVDLDAHRDPCSGELDNFAKDCLACLDTYAEVSQSGSGIHAILRGTIPDDRGLKDGERGIEIYSKARFFVMTGNHLAGTPRAVEARQEQLASLYKKLFSEKSRLMKPRISSNDSFSDLEILPKVKAATNGFTFDALFRGDWKGAGYGSHSEADAALLSYLRWRTGGDKARSIELFSQSGLNREKWQRKDYQERTWRLVDHGSTYSPKLAIRGIPRVNFMEQNELHRVLPEPISWEELSKPVDLTQSLLGDRFLERGCGLLLYGPSGCGKSIAAYQACAEWAAGLAGLHIRPAYPLRIVVIQTEDSENELREAMCGILSAPIFTTENRKQVEENLIMLARVAAGGPDHLGFLVEATARKHKPNLVLVNPLLAFCPGDPARELGALLYQVIDPIIKRYGLGFLGVHHTPKTGNINTKHFGAHDYQYLAAGDARVANWSRAMIQIDPVGDLYCFRATKRWQRIGWTRDNKATSEIHLRHSKNEVRWLDATPAELLRAEAADDYTSILEVLPKCDDQGISRERVRLNAKGQLKIGKTRADECLKLAIEDGLVERYQILTAAKRKQALFRRAKGVRAN